MIYLTAQRVISARKGAGVNCFLYRSDKPVPRTEGVLDLRAALSDFAGVLSNDEVEIAPGGNRVPSYVDLIAEERDVGAIEQAIRLTADQATRTQPPLEFVYGGVGVRFNCDVGLYDRARSELLELGERALRLLRRPEPSAWRSEVPLLVVVGVDDDRVTYQVDPPSVQKIRALKGGDWQPSKVSIEHATLADFEEMIREMVPSLARMLTGLEREQILMLGGVRFVDASGKTLAERPKRVPSRDRDATAAR